MQKNGKRSKITHLNKKEIDNMAKERNCQKCIHHISGSCSKWECEMQTLEDYRNKVIDEFAEKLYRKIADSNLNQYKDMVTNMIDEIAEQLKAGK